MEFLTNVNIDILGKRKVAFIISGIMILIGIVALIVNKGPIYNIDFKGGQIIEIGFDKVVDVGTIRSDVEKAGIAKAEIQSIGKGDIVSIRMPADVSAPEGKSASDVIIEKIKESYPNTEIELRRADLVGPKVSKELRKQATIATVLALLGIMIYIAIRFNFRFGIAAVIALFHDVFITLGLMTVFGREFSLPVLAALLTIVGYSINDTIVISDRIRENMKILYREKFYDLVNRSLNQTLSRTIITSIVVLLVLLSIIFFGGSVIFDFALALVIGVIVGTYSSVFIVSPIVVAWERISPKRVGGRK